MTYEIALKEFNKLPHVDSDQLEGTIEHLVFRAEHEIILHEEGEWEYCAGLKFKKSDQNKIKAFIKKWKGK